MVKSKYESVLIGLPHALATYHLAHFATQIAR